jgi:uncharacterized protein YbjT (DUF2867 family)
MGAATDSTVLVTGATGYIGGRLTGRLVDAGYRIRTMVRDRARVGCPSWLDSVEMVEADPLRPETLPQAMAGVSAAFYLIPSMAAGADFRQRDITGARQFGEAAKAAGIARIVYLGGLGDPKAHLSEHLTSRQETGDALRASGVPVTELRAAIVVGSGSVSFEMIRYLTERLPVMICPQWVFTRVQPIGIEDVLRYLIAALEKGEAAGQIIEIGGADVLTYGEMMIRYARARGLRRFLIPVPVLTPRLSSYWVHWVTPIRAAYARPLIEGLRNEVIVRDEKASTLLPEIRPLDYETALRQALAELQVERVAQRAYDGPGNSKSVRTVIQEGMIVERRSRTVAAPAEHVYRIFSGLGGRGGWLCFNWAWRLRASLDHLIGGVGLRRTRPDRDALREGDAVDFYRVEAVRGGRMVRLHVEMKLPGEGWVQFESRPLDERRAALIQTVFFAPKGLLGFLYWHVLSPAHSIVFTCMLRKIARKAEMLGNRPAG